MEDKKPRKGLAIAILEKSKRPEAEEPEEEDMGGTALSDAGSEVLAAIRAGDEAGFVDALKSFVSIMQGMD